MILKPEREHEHEPIRSNPYSFAGVRMQHKLGLSMDIKLCRRGNGQIITPKEHYRWEGDCARCDKHIAYVQVQCKYCEQVFCQWCVTIHQYLDRAHEPGTGTGR